MKKVKVKTKNIKQTKKRHKKKSHKYSFMITLKFAYKIIFGDKELLEKLRKQFTSLVHIFYNLIVDKPKITCREVKERIKNYNNLDLMDSILIQYAYEKAYEIYKHHKTPHLYGVGIKAIKNKKNA